MFIHFFSSRIRPDTAEAPMNAPIKAMATGRKAGAEYSGCRRISANLANAQPTAMQSDVRNAPFMPFYCAEAATEV